MVRKSSDKETIQDSLNRLEEIASWFERDSEFDVEEGLEKVKEGVALIKALRERLAAVENEFREVSASLDEDA